MDKFKLSLIAVSVLSTSIAFASSNTNNFFSTLQPKSEVNSTKNLMMHPPTDVTVVNASSSFIYAGVFGTNIHDFVRAGTNDHIYNFDPGIVYTPLFLEDPDGNYFYSQNVCRLAIVTVTGRPGNYRINTDSDLCN